MRMLKYRDYRILTSPALGLVYVFRSGESNMANWRVFETQAEAMDFIDRLAA